MDICKAVVKQIERTGPDGPFAIAIPVNRPDIGDSVAFSLDPSVWEENEWPEAGSVVLLGKLRPALVGWGAKEARFSAAR